MFRSKRSKLSIAVCGVIATSALIFSPLSSAQEEGDSAQNDSEEIVITGSRIKRSSAQMTTPTTVIDSVAIENSGVKNIGELMHQLPALLDGIGGTSNNDNGTGSIESAGMELANLRGLGVERTLVLVNGRRHVAGSSTSAAVDMSMIPVALIERIEIITGGASAIYGSDAVTGVINFVMKSNYEGTAIDIGTGVTSEGDGRSENFSITWGNNFSEGAGNITLSLSYADDEEIGMSSRDYANRDPGFLANPLNTGPDDGIADTVFAQDVRFQALSEEGLFYVPNDDWVLAGSPYDIINNPLGFPPTFADDPFGLGYDTFTIDRDTGAFRAFQAGVNCRVVPCDGGDGFRTQETNTLKSPSERINFTLNSHYDVSNDLRIFGEVKFGKVTSAASGQASVFHDDNFGPLIAIRSDNPFRPQPLVDLMTQRNLDVVALAVVGLNSRSLNERETRQVTVGGSGAWDTLSYDFYFQNGEVESQFRSQDVLNERYYEALDAISDGNGNAVCRSGNTNCVAFNPINNLASQQALDYVSVDLLRNDRITQNLASFSINGDLFDTDNGTIEFAAGVEYRRETAESNPDLLSQAVDPDGVGSGLVGSTTGASREENIYLNPVIGEVNLKEVFFETMIPLANDLAIAQSIDLDLAARYSDHSITGSDSTFKSGLNWAFNASVRSRLTFSKAVRAPNIQELFAPEQIGGQFVTDPCHVDELASRPADANDPHRVNCAALGLDPDFQSEAAFGTRNVLTQGNRNLNPEEAETFTAGIVYAPSSEFFITLDYWDIEITDAITSFDPSDVLRNCVSGSGLNQDFCSLVNRDGTGQINSISVQSINASKFLAEGIDLETQYTWLFNSGALNLSFKGTHLSKREFHQNPDDADDINDQAGRVGTPKFRALISTSYTNDDLSLTWTMNHIGSSTFNKEATEEQYPDWFNNKVPSFTYHNLNFNYTFDDRFNAYFGIDNATNKEPSNLPGLTSGGLLYDGIGRRFYTGIRITL